MTVIDSSSVVKFVLREDNCEVAEGALGSGCVSLEMALKETGNALWKLVSRKQMGARAAQERFTGIVRFRPFKLVDQAEVYTSAFEISAASQLPFYDSLFVALARDRKLGLVTSDRGQAKVAKDLGVEVQYIE